MVSGAPWDARQLEPFAGRNVHNMRLPEDHEIVAKEANDSSDIVFIDRKATA
jgi:hypothetical protein